MRRKAMSDARSKRRRTTMPFIRDYFSALKWDGTPRLDAWLITYLHADDTPYVRAIGPRFLISGAARIDKPGVQVDHTLVLEGPQGKLKSTTLRKLAIRDEWFTDRLSHVGTKDAMIETAGILLYEIAEMDALTRASPSATKRFLTSRYDRFRPPYGKHLVNVPRQCIFAGSINPPPTGRYLNDPTGARRIWPVACVGMIDLAGIERDRDQLWAEAIVRYQAGAPWWLDSPELEALATAEQAKRLKIDEWHDPIVNWLDDRCDVSVAEVLKGALGVTNKHQSQTAQNRAVKILKNLGFTWYRPNKKGRDRRPRYRRERLER